MTTTRGYKTVLAMLVLLLLFAAALRIQHLVAFVEWPDEIRSMWRTQGNFENLLIRTPDDWPPLYGALIWGWVRIAGPTLEASRFLSMLFGLLGLALLFRAAQRFMKGRSLNAPQVTKAALLSAITFATMGYVIFEGADVRAYSLLLMLGALALWLTMRWMDHPSWRRGLPLLVVLAVMFYSSFTSILLIAFLTLLVLVLKPRLLPVWGVIGLGVLLLTLPIVPKFFQNAPGRISNRIVQELPPFGDAMIKIYQDFGGSIWFLIPLVAACLAILWMAMRFPESRRRVLLLAGWIAVPAAVYFIIRNEEFMKARYMWWVGLGLALVIGYAVVRLPTAAQWGALAAFVLLPTFPVNFDTYRLAVTASPPFRETFSWFSKQLRVGDILIIDPNCTCGDRFAWDYFVPQYFPTGFLPIEDQPGLASRVWYLSTSGWLRDEALQQEIQNGRKPSIFYGPWFFLLQLYEGPPSWTGIAFDGRIRLHGAEIEQNDFIMAKDESFRIKLWWSALQALDQDYSMSVAVLNMEGQLVTQVDGPAMAADTPEQTSMWQPGVYYEDFREFRLPADLPDGRYRLVATVYQWQDGVRLTPTQNSNWARTGDGNTLVILKEIEVVS